MGQHHVRVYKQLGCEITGVVDASIERARYIGEKYHVPYCTEYEKLLGKVEAVTIATPTGLHNSIALDFLARGVHCLVEKPIALDVGQARELITAARGSGAKLMVGHIERFNPAVQKLKRLIKQGVLGKIMLVSTRRVGPMHARVGDVGIIADSATHDIDVVRYLFGEEPETVYARVGRFRHSKEDHALITLGFLDSAASIEVNWFTPHKVRNLVITGTRAIAYLDYMKQNLSVHSSSSDTVYSIDKSEPLKEQLEHFLGCILNCSEPLVDGTEGMKNLRIANEATRAASCNV